MLHLNTEQRYVIAALYKRDVKIKEIAKEIKVNPSSRLWAGARKKTKRW